MEFNVDNLESVILDEAQGRGERFFRISVRAQEEVLFPRERLCLDSGRMEKAFNVVRAWPEGCEVQEFPDRVLYYITTAQPFEKTAGSVSSFLNGAVDIAELPFASWRGEKAHSRNDRGPSRAKGLDARRTEIAMLILSYKILHFDMERICGALPSGGAGSSEMRERMESFERRMEGLDAARIAFLSFTAGGEKYLIPRFFVSGFRWGGAGEDRGWEPDREGGRLEEAVSIDPETGETGTDGRYGILLGSGPAVAVRAERLVAYREMALGELRITGRRSRLCFDAEAGGEAWRLVLPEQSMAGRGRAE